VRVRSARTRAAAATILGLLVPIAVVATVAAACIPPRPSPSPADPAPSIAEPAPPTTAAVPTAIATGPLAIAVDPTLLDVLPSEVAGVPLRADPATAADIAGETSIAPFVSAIAVAAAFGPQATDRLTDYVVVTVARLRPGTFGDLFYRGWRDTFDVAVCEQSGGVTTHAEADIGGRHTFIGTCQGGVHTYHVHLVTTSGDVMVSMQGLGDAGFAERVVAGLRE
jgi:hypothetical protein